VRRPLATAVTNHRIKHRRGEGIARLDSVVVINLEHREDRLAGFALETQRLAIENVRRFEAIPHASGIIGCSLSHAALARMMIAEGWNAVMVCEDDARFLASRAELDVLADAFLDDPAAEVACLAYNLKAASGYSRLFLRARQTQTAACYLLKRSIVKDLLAVWEAGISELERGGDRNLFGLDRAWWPLQSERVFLVPVRRAAVQEDGFSDIERRNVYYGV
jgi:glycosyl transferase family 25